MDPQAKTGASKYVILIAIIAVVIIAFSLMGKKQSEPTKTQPTETPSSAATPTQNDKMAAPTINSDANTTSAAERRTAGVDYTDQGFTPKEITIKIGDTVKFVNKSSEDMWVGSAMHPTHMVYSGTALREHCPDTGGTAFDQCGAGNEFSFTFNKIGSWAYHNHADATQFGKVTVTEK